MLDNGAGGGAPAGPGGIFGMVESMAQSAMDVMIDLTAMDSFKSRVDELLNILNDSQAAPTKMGQDRIARTKLGGEFAEAEFLYAAYSTVHDQLETLSKVLGLQIESMHLAVQASQVSYDNLDESVKQKMQALNTQIDAHYDQSRDPYAKKHGTSEFRSVSRHTGG